MSCSRPSKISLRSTPPAAGPDGLNRSGGRLLRAAIALGLAVAAATGVGGCRDELSPPTHGVLEVVLTSPSAGGYAETRVTMEGGGTSDSVLIASATDARYEFIVPAGTVTLTAAKECAHVGPSPTQELQIPPGGHVVARWSIEPGSAIEVVSTPPGAAIRLDGAATGRFTPATLTCIEPGPHTVSVALLGTTAGADSARSIQVADQPVRVDFALVPIVQPRTALLEIFTATYCPNCGPADAAAALLWETLGPAQGYIGLQIHTRWGGRDSLATPTTLARNALYGDQERLGIPAAIVGGTLLHRGAGGLDVPAIAEIYSGLVEQVTAQPTPLAFHWISTGRTPEVEARGRARLMATGALPDTAWRVWAAIYKDDLRTIGIEGPNQEFRHNVREFRDLGSLGSLGIRAAGDYADLEPVFDLSGDRRKAVGGAPAGSVWSEEAMGMVFFVQEMTNREILQATHHELP